jgi:DNA-binding MarR family transcriptional regulator
MYIHVNFYGLILSSNEHQLDLRGTGYCGSLNFRRTARAVTRLYDQAFQSSGLKSTQFTILVGVAKTQPTSVGALSSLLVIDSTTLTRGLKRLQGDGLLTVSKRAAKRQRFVTLTPAGEKLLADSLPAWRVAQERFVQAIGADYWIHFRGELERLAKIAVHLGETATALGDAGQRSTSP